MDGIIKVSGASVPVVNQGVSIEEAIELFVSECDIRENSRNVYRRGLLYFFKWVEKTGRTISKLTRADIITFKDSLLNTHSNLSVASYLVALRRFYEWAEGNKLYPNIAKGIKSPKRKNAYLKEHLRENQIADLLAHFEGNTRDYAIVNLLLRTGLRCIEVVRANVEESWTRRKSQDITEHNKRQRMYLVLIRVVFSQKHTNLHSHQKLTRTN